MAYGFPSPTGDLYFSIVPVLTSHAGLNPFPSPTGDLYFSIVHVKSEITDFPSFPSPTGDLYFSIDGQLLLYISKGNISVPYRGLIFLNIYWSSNNSRNSFPSPTGDLYFSIPSPQFLVNTDCITQFAWEMIFQKYKFIFHYKKLSKCLFYAVRGKTNIF